MENTTSIEALANQFIDRVGNKWVYDLDIVDLDDNEFWIKNRSYIQKDKLIKYNLFKRLELWEYDIKEQLQAYKQELVESTEMLDSVPFVIVKLNLFGRYSTQRLTRSINPETIFQK